MFETFRDGGRRNSNPFDEFDKSYSKMTQAIEDAQYNIEKGDLSTAALAFQEAAEKHDECHESLTYWIETLKSDGEYQIAYELLQDVQRGYDVFYDLAERFSIDICELKALTLAHFETLRGMLLVDMGKYRVAIKSFDKALDLHSGFTVPRLGKGQALLALENYQTALEAFEAALESDWYSVYAWMGKGDALLAMEQPEEAFEAYSTVLELNEAEPEIYFRQLICLIWLGRYSDALEFIKKIQALHEDSAVAWYMRYIVLDCLGDEQDSTFALNKALRIDPAVADSPLIQDLNSIVNATRSNRDASQSPASYTDSSINVSRGDAEITPVSMHTSSGIGTPAGKANLAADEFKPSSKPKKPIPYRKGSDSEGGDESLRGFACVAGMEDLKKRLRQDIIRPLKNPEKYRRFRVSIPNGILFFGPPGCGKTFIVRKLAEELGFTFIEVHHSSIGSPYIHGTARNIADKFQEARDHAPTILFFDEIEGMVPKRENLLSSGNHKQEEVGEFLAHLDNASEHKILIIGATNQPDLIDSAIMRSGRMDKRIYVPPPDQDARRALFENGLAGRPCSYDIDLDKLARLTEDYASSDIILIVEEAARAAVDLDRDEIDMEILLWKVSEIKSSLLKSQIAKYKQFDHLER